MKNKKILIIIAVLIVAAGGWYLLKGKGPGGVTSKYSKGSPFKGSLKAAVELGIPMNCSYEVNGTEYSGYIKGMQYRGTVKTQQGEGNIIMKDNCAYTWADTETQGIKVCYDLDEMDIWEPQEGAAEIDYQCYPAAITDAQFQLPSGIEFIDIDAMTNTGY